MASTLIRVLIWADLLAVYAIWALMTYLTDVWELSITHAAGILNIWGGIILTLPIGFAYLADACLGNYTVLAFASVAYSIGMGFLAMSTPPVLSNSTGKCSKYEPECIGRTHKALFYTALALIAVGMAGHIASLKPFMKEQTPVGSGKDRTLPRKRELFFALFTVIGGIALPYIKPWSIRFGIPAICTLVATILFLGGTCLYDRKKPEGSPLTNIFRVIVASASKVSKLLPGNPEKLYKGVEDQGEQYNKNSQAMNKLHHTHGLRCLDKAAIKLENQESRWRLCTVTEVEETKIAIRMIPMWMTFIICGLVFSAGNTYFQEQANHLSRKVGKLKVPLQILLLLQESAKGIFSSIYNQYLKKILNSLDLGRYVTSVGIAGAMIFATLSCITAAKVEAQRLDVVRSHDLIDKSEDTIPMNIFWMLPQFVLLAGLDSFFEKSVTDFFCDQSPTSMAKYLDYFTHGVFGLGYMASVLSVYVIGKISESGGKSNWFQYTLNKSRLDNYFWTLAGLCAVNFVVYILVAYFYPYREQASGDEAQQDEQ